MEHAAEDDVERAEAHEGQAHHAHAHHSAAGEGDHQGRVEAFARCVGGADVGRGGHAHAEEAGQTGGDGTNDEGDGDHPVALLQAVVGHAQGDGHGDDEDRQDLVLAGEEGHGTITDVASNLLHPVGARVLLVDP